MLKILFVTALVAVCVADLRMASQPKNQWKAIDRNRNVPFVEKGKKYALYMEPSDFNYAGLKNQRQNAYDNFLRSNIDNEQDRRNFNTEPGRDHLPFRSYETAATDASVTVQTKIPAVAPGPAIKVTPGTPYLIPLRWNNPHASELEVNIWIMKRTLPGNIFKSSPVVVPIRKPTCSGEGHQDNVFDFTVPTDFLALGAKVPGFFGCKQIGDCVLQVYAHSVESRTYAIGTPLIVEGTFPPPTATTDLLIAAPIPEVGVDKAAYESLKQICRPSNDPGAHYKTSNPRWARLVSDVFNHAYQNSDFSPYSGQQPEEISQNLQASAILKMTVGNRGELGKTLFAKNGKGAQLAKNLDKKARELIRVYESITNQIISAIGKNMSTIDNTTMGAQKTDYGFRCAETGAVNAARLTTNTYVPSFVIPANLLPTAKLYVAPIYKSLITDYPQGGGILQIYNAVLNDMNDEFIEAGKLNVHYMGAMLKDTTATMMDATQFIKKNADGKNDGGLYAATLAQKAITDNSKNVKSNTVPKNLASKALNSIASGVHQLFLDAQGALIAAQQADMNGVMGDSNCDNDATWTEAKEAAGCEIPGTQYPRPGQLFPDEGQVPLPATLPLSAAASSIGASVATFCVVVAAVFANM